MIYASEIRFINYLRPKKKIDLDIKKLITNLSKGYKCWFETDKTIYKNIKNLSSFNLLEINGSKRINKKIFFKNFLYIKEKKKNNYTSIKKKLREVLIDTIDKTLRSDVPLAYSLSGGIDSNLIVSISKKILNVNQATNILDKFINLKKTKKNIKKKINLIGQKILKKNMNEINSILKKNEY